MIWNYRCPKCGQWRQVEWDERDQRLTCHETDEAYVAPSPAEQIEAFVDEQTPPDEMDQAVRSRFPNKCVVPGCKNEPDTLDHVLAYANLQPMCGDHNTSKCDQPYWEWLFKLLPPKDQPWRRF
jgi:hypothetical protein